MPNVPASALLKKLAAKKKKNDKDGVPARSTKASQDKAAKDLANRTDSSGVRTKTGDLKPSGKPASNPKTWTLGSTVYRNYNKYLKALTEERVRKN